MRKEHEGGLLPVTDPTVGTLVLDLQPLELWENGSLLFELPSLRRLLCAHSGLIQSGKGSEVAFLLAQVVKNPPEMQET